MMPLVLRSAREHERQKWVNGGYPPPASAISNPCLQYLSFRPCSGWIATVAVRANCRHASDWAGLHLSFRSAFLRDRSVCFDHWIVEGPTGNGAHAIKAGENA